MTKIDPNDSPVAVQQDAMQIVNMTAAETARCRLNGSEPPAYVTEASQAAKAVVQRAAAVEMDQAAALTAAMEHIDPETFGRRVRARRRMAALRKKGAVR